MARDAIEIADYFIERSDCTKTHMQIQKMVYMSHGYMLGVYHTPLISNPVEAWDHGPVIPSMYQRFKKHGHNPIERHTESPQVPFTTQEMDVLNFVWNKHNRHCGYYLSRLTHSDGTGRPTPWESARAKYGDHKRAPITNDMTEQYYSRVYEEMQNTA